MSELENPSESSLSSCAIGFFLPALGAAAGAEMVAVVARSNDALDIRSRLDLGLELAGYLALPLVLSSLALSALWLLLRHTHRRAELAVELRISNQFTRADLCATSALILSAYGCGLYGLSLALLHHFKNQELALLVLSGAAAAGLILSAYAAWLLLAAWLRLRAALGRYALAIPLIVVALALFLVLYPNRRGLGQLNPWLLAAPLTALAAGGLLRKRLARASTRARVWCAGSVAGAVIASVGVSRFDLELPSRVVRAGSWSGFAIELLRTASDFDGDGYSSFFGGGDCAPFDPAVHPGAAEIPGDGIDNNCVGGDAGKQAQRLRPRWFDLPTPLAPKLNLVVISVETLRADHVSFEGAARDTTPHLREFSKGAAVFENMFSSAPTTRLSLPALLSSCLPSEIDWAPQAYAKQMRHILPSTPWLPEILARAGFVTIAVHTDFRAFTAVESAGFERGFSHYDTSTRLRYAGGTMYGFPAREQVDKAEKYLTDAAGQRTFLWMHLMEPHYMYERSPEAPNWGDDERALYDSEVWEVDRQVGRFLDFLRAQKLLEQTLVFFSGDHGEEFGEHGQRWHGSNLYQPQVRPAAFLWVPGIPGQRISDAVGFSDVAPALLNLLGVRNGFQTLRNRNLTPLLFGHALSPRGVFLESFTVDVAKNYMTAFVDWPMKLIYTEDGGLLERYDLSRDPAERNRLPPGSTRAREMEQALFGFLEGSARRNPPPAPIRPRPPSD